MDRNLAVAMCRVSTAEQRDSNSLNRQESNIRKAAEDLNVEIIKIWSGDVSSRVGKNIERKDLKEVLEFCKKNKRVKYIIIDEVDRFMRSIKEMFYWLVELEQIKVKVYFASDPSQNIDDAKSSFFLAMAGYKAEGSNEERIFKSVDGHTKALLQGRYTFPPKPGYTKSLKPGIHDKHPVTFKLLQESFKSIVLGIETPLNALKKLNQTPFAQHHATWKMDKFSQFACDPYYCGILEIDAQVKVRNENGLHEPMLTKEEHERLVSIFKGKYKPRGPKMQYNPDFPMNKILQCKECGEGVKYTGSKKSNGYAKKTVRYYWKYHCRGCGKSFHRVDVHEAINNAFDKVVYDGWQSKEFVKALKTIWDRKQKSKLDELDVLKNRREALETTKSRLIREMVKAEDEYKADYRDELEKVKNEIIELGTKINSMSDLDGQFIKFVEFALDYTNELKEDWWELNHDDRARGQLLLIPGGIFIDSKQKVGTQNFTDLYTVIPKKKATSVAIKSLMVELAGTAPASD
jgi:DNA invertase Pin-like site-specific DNA recombinase